MELKQLKYFIEVAKKQHMTQAAKKLHVAQSAVSRQIANLEDELGVQLFVRHGRRLQLTPVGNEFLEHVEDMIVDLDKVVKKIGQKSSRPLKSIHVGCPHSLAAYMIPEVVSNFKKQYPDVQFKLHPGTVNQLSEKLVQGDIDLAFVSPVPSDHPEVEGVVLFTEELQAVFPHDHPYAHKLSIRLDQLKDEAFVLFRPGYLMRSAVLDACEHAGFQPRIAFEGEDSVTIRGIVGAGLGISVLPTVALKNMQEHKVAAVKIREPRLTRTVGYIVHKYRQLSLPEKQFLHFLQNFYQQDQYYY